MGKHLTILIAMGVWGAWIMETEHNVPTDAEPLISVVEALRPLHRKLGKPGPHDWLAHHHEPGQTFREYSESDPVTPQGERSVIYLQPLGEFTETQREMITITADFMSRFYHRPVRIPEDIPLSTIPNEARRRHPQWGMKQILTTYVLDDVLRPRLPADAAASIAFTTSDLWPGRGWNFVFGQASLRRRVGVWSIYRNGDPNGRNRSPAPSKALGAPASSRLVGKA